MTTIASMASLSTEQIRILSPFMEVESTWSTTRAFAAALHYLWSRLWRVSVFCERNGRMKDRTKLRILDLSRFSQRVKIAIRNSTRHSCYNTSNARKRESCRATRIAWALSVCAQQSDCCTALLWSSIWLFGFRWALNINYTTPTTTGGATS